jgi:hypothetical protein
MLRMNPEYARMHEDRAERTIAWLATNLGVKSFTTPKIETIDVLAADAGAAAATGGTKRRSRSHAGGAGGRTSKAASAAKKSSTRAKNSRRARAPELEVV